MPIELVAIEAEHIPYVQRYASNPIIGKTSNVPSPFPENGAEQWYQHIKSNMERGVSKVFAIIYQGEFAGIISLNKLNTDSCSANVDYWVRADLHGQGVATKAVNILLEYARGLGVFDFHSGCLAINTASERVLVKNGFSEMSRQIIDNGKFVGKEYISMRRTYS